MRDIITKIFTALLALTVFMPSLAFASTPPDIYSGIYSGAQRQIYEELTLSHASINRFTQQMYTDYIDAHSQTTTALYSILRTVICADPTASIYYSHGTTLRIATQGSRFRPVTAVSDGVDVNARISQAKTKASSISKTATAKASTQRKNRSFADYRYMRSAYQTLAKRLTYSTSSSTNNDMYGALVENRSQCWGMALAYSYVLDLRSIPNLVGTGTMGDMGEHAFTLVRYQSKWYVCDLTFSDPRATLDGFLVPLSTYKKVAKVTLSAETTKAMRLY